jgi:hypothetical protein
MLPEDYGEDGGPSWLFLVAMAVLTVAVVVTMILFTAVR